MLENKEVMVYQCINHNEDSLGVMQTLHNLCGVIILFSMKVYIDILRPYEMRADKFRGRKRVSLGHGLSSTKTGTRFFFRSRF